LDRYGHNFVGYLAEIQLAGDFETFTVFAGHAIEIAAEDLYDTVRSDQAGYVFDWIQVTASGGRTYNQVSIVITNKVRIIFDMYHSRRPQRLHMTTNFI
jgi:hypothetical protein